MLSICVLLQCALQCVMKTRADACLYGVAERCSALLQCVVAVRCCSVVCSVNCSVSFNVLKYGMSHMSVLLQCVVAVRCCNALLQCVVAVSCCSELLQ